MLQITVDYQSTLITQKDGNKKESEWNQTIKFWNNTEQLALSKHTTGKKSHTKERKKTLVSTESDKKYLILLIYSSHYESSKHNMGIAHITLYSNSKPKQRNSRGFKKIPSHNLGDGLYTISNEELVRPTKEKITINAKDARGNYMFIMNLDL